MPFSHTHSQGINPIMRGVIAVSCEVDEPSVAYRLQRATILAPRRRHGPADRTPARGALNTPRSITRGSRSALGRLHPDSGLRGRRHARRNCARRIPGDRCGIRGSLSFAASRDLRLIKPLIERRCRRAAALYCRRNGSGKK